MFAYLSIFGISALQSIYIYIYIFTFNDFLLRFWEFNAQAVFLPFQLYCLVIYLPET